MNKIFAISRNTFLEMIRSKILLSVLLFAIFMILISGLFGSVSIGEPYIVIKSFGYFLISLAGAVTAIISAVSLFQKEIVQKTIYNILSKSVTRRQFIIGKVLGLWLTCISTVFLMLVLLQLALYPIEGALDPLLLQGFLCMSFELLIIVSVTVFFSTMSVTPVLPGLFTLGVYISGKSIFYLRHFIDKEGYSSFAKQIAQVFDIILPDLHVLTPYDRLVYGISMSTAEIITAGIYSLLYASFLVLISSWIFARRDL